MGGDEDFLVSVGLPDLDELVVLLQRQSADSVVPEVLQRRNGQTLHRAVPGDHGEEPVLVGDVTGVDHGGHLLVAVHLKDVDDVAAPGGAARLRDLIALLAEHPALVGEEENMVVGGGGEHGVHVVLLPCGHGLLAHAALALRRVLAGAGALDVAVGGHGKDALLLLNEILHVQIVLGKADLSLAVVAVLVPDLNELVLEDAAEHSLVAEQLVIIGDLLFQLLILGLQLLLFQSLQALELHIQNGLGLHVGQAEAVHQVFPGVVVALPDNADDLVDVVLRDEQALQQMGALLRLPQVVPGAPGDDLFLKGDILVQHLPQGQRPGVQVAVLLDQRQHDHGEGGLHLGLGEQAVEGHLRVGVLFQLDDDAHALLAIGLVPQAGNALQPLFLHLIGDVLHQTGFVHLIGQLGDDDAGAAIAELLHLRPGADADVALAGAVGGADAGAAHNDAPGGKIRALDVLHQVVQRGVIVFENADDSVDDLPQVVGRDVGGHAHGDAGGAVDQQVGEPGGHHLRLLQALVKVGVPVHGVLVDVPHQLVADLGHAGLGITVGGGGVAVHGAEVSVAGHQRIPHGEVLRQTDHGVVHGGVAVGVVFTQHVAHAGGGLLEGLVRGQARLVHGVEDAPVNGLQAVPHVGQGAAHDDGHGVLDIRALHLVLQIDIYNFLIGKGYIPGHVIVFIGHL